jgi:hypothetical protein
LILPAGMLVYLLGSSDKWRRANPLQDGSIEFTPNVRSFWVWPVVVTYLTYATISCVSNLHGRPVNIVLAVYMGVLTVMIASSFPGSIIVTAQGLQQIFWLWRDKRIKWEDIVEINTGGTDRTVTIKSTNGTKITHRSQLPDRPRLLMEIKHYCGTNLPSDFLLESLTMPRQSRDQTSNRAIHMFFAERLFARSTRPA